jgi:hypothetical protein
MYISVAYGRTHGLLTSGEAYQPGNDNDEPGGATPIALTEPPGDDREPMEEPPHQLWLSPGRGAAGLNASAAVRTALNCPVGAVDLPDPRGYAVKSLRAPAFASARNSVASSAWKRSSGSDFKARARAGMLQRRRTVAGVSAALR